jgi:hypothetical protein
MAQTTLIIRMVSLIWCESLSNVPRFNWSLGYKWFLTVTVCFISILTGLPAGSYGAGDELMASRFNVQNEPFPNLYWATCSWNIGAALFPLLFVPLTENTGRMPGYFVSPIQNPSELCSYKADRVYCVRALPLWLCLC